MTTDDLVKVDKKTQFLIINILKRDYVNSRAQEENNGAKKKNYKKNYKSKVLLTLLIPTMIMIQNHLN